MLTVFLTFNVADLEEEQQKRIQRKPPTPKKSVSFASSGHMRHAVRVQNIISVTTVTMRRLMPFLMFLFVYTVHLLMPVNISQISIQMDLFLPLDSSGSYSVVSNFSPVF